MVESDGFARENEYVTMFIPSQLCAFVFKVKRRGNNGYNSIHYGSLPLIKGTSLPTYDGNGSAIVPEDGVLPANAYTPAGISFPLDDAYDENDMWYTPASYHDRLMHVKMHIDPSMVRVGLEMPKGVKQYKFQKDNVVAGVDKNLGFARGAIETMFIPELHYGFVFGNDTNVDLRTNVTFDFAEYVIEVPTDPIEVYDVLVGDRPSHWVDLPVSVYDSSIAIALKKTYGFEGFTVDDLENRESSIAAIDQLIAKYYNG